MKLAVLSGAIAIFIQFKRWRSRKVTRMSGGSLFIIQRLRFYLTVRKITQNVLEAFRWYWRILVKLSRNPKGRIPL